MRITKIELENFRAFHNDYSIDLSKDGKNLLVYGENGSGKSSLFKALKYFLDSHRQNLNFVTFKNVFSQHENGFIKFYLREDRNSPETSIVWSKDVKETNNRIILESAKTKAFIDYKKLLETYFLHIDENEVNIYELLMHKLIANIENETTSKSFIDDYNTLIDYEHGKHADILKNFNDSLRVLLDKIAKQANKILNAFDYKIQISFEFEGVKKFKIKERDERIKNKKIILKVDFFEKIGLDQHHLILNEAKLSAIAISIFFASILEQPQSDLKILALDDVLIGLDMTNRMPIIDILEEYFADYQIFFMTYDKTWFEIISQKMPDDKWKKIELYHSKSEAFEIPIYAENKNYLQKAEHYLERGDLKASVVYLRSFFEDKIKKFCNDNRLKVRFLLQQKRLDTDDFLEPIAEILNDNGLMNEIKLHRQVILNPLSHSSIAEIESGEVRKSIEIVKKLTDKLSKITVEQKKIKNEAKLEKVVEIVNKELSFEKDVYLKLIEIKSTIALNEFLKEDIYKNIEKFSANELERFFDEMRLAQKVSIFDLETEANFIRIFTKKDWEARQKKIWCRFVQFLDNNNKLQDKFFIQKLIEKQSLKQAWSEYNNQESWIDCDFLDRLIEDEDIPF